MARFSRAAPRQRGPVRRRRFWHRSRRERPPGRRSGWLWALVVAVGLLLALPRLLDLTIAGVAPAAAGGCRVVRVVDGDTVRMRCPARAEFAARITGIDAPELASPKCPSELVRAIAAGWHLRRIILEARGLAFDFAGGDRYGRTLVTIFADGRSVGERMIADGQARAYEGARRGGWCAAAGAG